MAGSKKPPAVTPELLMAPRFTGLQPCSRILYLGLRAMAAEADDGVVPMTLRQLHAAFFPVDPTLDLTFLVAELTQAKLVAEVPTGGWSVFPIEVAKAKKKPVAPAMTQSRSELVKMVFDHYVKVMDKPRARLDDKRKICINRALQTYTARELSEAITGYTHSPFHMGENDRHRRYDDIELLLRDARRIEEGLELYHRHSGAGGNGGGGAGAQRRNTSFDRWSDEVEGEASTGGLPKAGSGATARNSDTRGVASGADAGKQRKAGPGYQDGIPFD